MKLFHNPMSRSGRVRWALDEIGAPYEIELVDMRAGAHKSAEFLALHPLGKLPVLEVDGQYIFESMGICLFLADRFPAAGLAPAADSTARGAYYQWVLFAATELEPLVADYANNTSSPYFPAELKNPARAAWCKDGLQPRFERLAAGLAQSGGPYLLGEQFTMADLLCAGILQWGRATGGYTGHPGLDPWLERVLARPARTPKA